MRKKILILIVLLTLALLAIVVNSLTSNKDDKLTNKDIKDIQNEIAENSEPKNDNTDKHTIVDVVRGDSFFELNEQDSINLSSVVDTLGEHLEVIKQQGNASLVRGKYGDILPFYRLYLIDNEGVNIYYEVTQSDSGFEEIQLLMEEAKYEEIFNLEPNQEFFILKTPYEVGNEWGYGKITSADDDTVIVEYENGNKTIFEKGYGITEMHYNIPEDMREYFTEEEFKAVKTEG